MVFSNYVSDGLSRIFMILNNAFIQPWDAFYTLALVLESRTFQ